MKQLETKKANKPPVFIAMDEFLVNLPGKGGEHYLQTKLVLRTADSTTEKRITDFLPLVRDRVLKVFERNPRFVDGASRGELFATVAPEDVVILVG
jgi:flagellar basal body-associated protein FliL